MITFPQSELELDAFWGRLVCLSCGAKGEEDEDLGEGACPTCDSPAWYPAATVLACAAAVEPPDELAPF